MKLDYTLPQSEKLKLVEQILIDANPTPYYLEILADYLLQQTKEEKKEKKIITPNRKQTMAKRELSLEGLGEKLENDGLYNLIANDKNIIFSPTLTITQRDIAEIPALRQLRQAIATVEQQVKYASGKRLFDLKKSIIQMRQDQYVIKGFFRGPINFSHVLKTPRKVDIQESIILTDDLPISTSLSLLNPASINLLLNNYSALKQDSYECLSSDFKYLILDLEDAIARTFTPDSHFRTILIGKIDGDTNKTIQSALAEKHSMYISAEYISTLWQKKIPNLIAAEEQERYLNYYYTYKEKGKYKKCNRCGEVKLAHSQYFSKNKSSKDGLYTICKECRRRK